jgi:hypothetical protein
MAEAEPRHLQAVGTGELPAEGPQTLAEALAEIDYLTDQLTGAENNVRSMRTQMANLKRELAGEIDEQHKLFPQAVGLFRYWQGKCDHPRMKFTADRMALVLPFLKRHKPETIREAIRGAAFDPFTVTRKNGTKHEHNGWHQIFANEDKFQDYRKRAPDYGPPTFTQQSLIDHAREIAGRVLEPEPDPKPPDPAPVEHKLARTSPVLGEQVAMLKPKDKPQLPPEPASP